MWLHRFPGTWHGGPEIERIRGMKRRILEEYKSKLRIPDEAVQLVRSENFIFYSHFARFPEVLDEALARRVG